MQNSYNLALIEVYKNGGDIAEVMQRILRKYDINATVSGDENYLEVNFRGYSFSIVVLFSSF